MSSGVAENAGEFLKRLFAFAFQTKDRLIYLPGQYPDPPPSLAVRAELQAGLTLTFLQHGKTRKLEEVKPYLVDPDGSGIGVVPIDFRPCTWFKHQDGWKELVDRNDRLSTKPVASDQEAPEEPEAAVAVFSRGDLVEVRRYGRGVVEEASATQVTVAFADRSRRSFLPEYVRRAKRARAPAQGSGAAA